MDILITGGQGQLGLELAAATWPEEVKLHAPTREALDLSSPESVRAFFAAGQYAAVINAAAYTAVDRAESEVGAAFAANSLGPALLAEATKATKTPLIQISTDYVFDGSNPDIYRENDPVRPLGVYGASKEAGEQAVRTGNGRSVILRTAWVVSPHRQNFIKTMLRLGSERPLLRVVDDQRGCPTSAADLAAALVTIALRLIRDPSAPTGAYHFVNDGDTTWCGLARHVFETASGLGGPNPSVEAITTAEFPTPARRPANSRLSTALLRKDFGISPRPWQTAVNDIVGKLLSARV
jgi:dTDP-4-dehydrorhamnose reductase